MVPRTGLLHCLGSACGGGSLSSHCVEVPVLFPAHQGNEASYIAAMKAHEYVHIMARTGIGLYGWIEAKWSS